MCKCDMPTARQDPVEFMCDWNPPKLVQQVIAKQ